MKTFKWLIVEMIKNKNLEKIVNVPRNHNTWEGLD